ncbi:MAG: SDR family NAD(P)-dependent oxidoreductase [Chloroflexi bacterium]|nr:SDR family NAD(P)-dependent oxidoreductase [Chloroflexota bacterium]
MSDASGRVVVLSGATSGIGNAAARALAAGGARLTLVGRNEALLAELAAELGDATDWVVADLASLEQTRRAAAEIRERHDRLDVLINNAGGFFSRRGESAEGLELSLALNHLSPFVLTSELLPLLHAAAEGDREFGARIVNVASSAHRSGVQWDGLAWERRYGMMRAYGQAKALMIMTTNELARRLEGTGVTANSVHPGVVRTGIIRKSGNRLLSIGFDLVARWVLLSPERGAGYVLHLATSDEVAGVSGTYWSKDRIEEPAGDAADRAAQERAWTLSEQLAGMTAAD